MKLGDEGIIEEYKEHCGGSLAEWESSSSKKLPQVHDFIAQRDSLQIAAYVMHSSEPEGNEEGKKHHCKEIRMDSDTPELVALFEEHSYQVVKDIFMDEEVPSLKNKCLIDNFELDHKNISWMLNSEVDNDSAPTNRTMEKKSSMRNKSKLRIENHSGKDMMIEDEDGYDDKMVPQKQHIAKVESREADLTNSLVASATVVTDDNSHTSNTSSEIEEESERSIIHPPDSSSTTVNRKEDQLRQKSGIKRLPHETQDTSKPQYETEMSQSQNLSSQIFVHQHDHQGQGETNSFSIPTTLPYSGSISFRSNSSTASSHSFAFPILASEWNESPVRMVKADRRQLRKQQNWRMCFLCCKF